MTTIRYGGHQCKTCKTNFKGKGSKDRARECFSLGKPKHRYKPGTRVVVKDGRFKGQVCFVLEGKYRRWVVKEKGKIVQALHVKHYRLQPVNNTRRVLWPWPTESQIKVVRA